MRRPRRSLACSRGAISARCSCACPISNGKPPTSGRLAHEICGTLPTPKPMDTFLKDLTYAARGLRKNLGFAVVATMTIALGIGACTAIFSVVNAVLLRPLPYVDAQRLVVLWGELRARNVKDWPFAPPDLRDLKQQSTDTFEDIAGMVPAGRTNMSQDGGEPEQIRDGRATQNLCPALRPPLS